MFPCLDIDAICRLKKKFSQLGSDWAGLCMWGCTKRESGSNWGIRIQRLEAGTKRGGGTTWISGPAWLTLLTSRCVFSCNSNVKSHFRWGFVWCKEMRRERCTCRGEEEEAAASFWAASHTGLLKLCLIKSAAQNVIKLAREQIALTLVGQLPRFILPCSVTVLSMALPCWSPGETSPKTRGN